MTDTQKKLHKLRLLIRIRRAREAVLLSKKAGLSDKTSAARQRTQEGSKYLEGELKLGGLLADQALEARKDLMQLEAGHRRDIEEIDSEVASHQQARSLPEGKEDALAGDVRRKGVEADLMNTLFDAVGKSGSR